MAKYEARLTAPYKNNKNYIHTSAGGYNQCIEISGGSCLPNCVGYAWGRWREILKANPKLSRGNAEDWFGNTADGYKRGSTPKLGAVICWRKGNTGNGSDGYGHIAVVEQIKEDGTIVTSESAYGGSRWKSKEYKAPNYYLASGYVFQGFIYLPITFGDEAVTVKQKSNTEIAKEVINGDWGNGETRKEKLKTAGYDYNAIQEEVNKLLSADTPKPSTFGLKDSVKLIKGATYYNGKPIPSWLFNTTLYVREIDEDRVVISTLKSGAITGAVNKKYLKKI